MRNAIVLNQKDIKKMLAEHYGVDEKDILNSQYSYTIMLTEENSEDE